MKTNNIGSANNTSSVVHGNVYSAHIYHQCLNIIKSVSSKSKNNKI
jgi:hypothetical protein